jgi:hypothetical protein
LKNSGFWFWLNPNRPRPASWAHCAAFSRTCCAITGSFFIRGFQPGIAIRCVTSSSAITTASSRTLSRIQFRIFESGNSPGCVSSRLSSTTFR